MRRARRSADEPLLAAVFEVIERRYQEPLSLADVAAELALTPGHLTTAVRRRTGRTVRSSGSPSDAWSRRACCSPTPT